MRIDADRDIEVKPERHRQALRPDPTGAQLPVGQPLDEFVELDIFARGAAQRIEGAVVGPAPG